MNARETRIDVSLTNFAIGYHPGGMVADIVIPRVAVGVDTGKYPIFDTNNMKEYFSERAQYSDPNLVDETLTYGTFESIQHSLGKMIDDKDKARVPFGLEEQSVQRLIDRMMVKKELEAVKVFNTLANYSSSSFYETFTGGNKIDSESTGLDLEKTIDDAANVIRTNTGVSPNTLLLPWNVKQAIKRNGQYQSQRINVNDLTQTGFPSNLWGYNVVIAEGLNDSAKEGQTRSFADMWKDVNGNEMFSLFYLDPAITFDGPAWAKNFSFGQEGLFVTRKDLSEDKPNNAERIEVWDNGRDMKVVGNTAAYLFQDVLE